MNDHNLQTKIYKLICTSPTNIFAAADLAQKIMVLFGEAQPKSKTPTAMQTERDLLKRQNTQHIKDMTAQQQRIGRLHEECLEKGGDILHLQKQVADLKNLNRTAGGENMEKLQGQLQFIVKQRNNLVKQRNNLTLEHNKAKRKVKYLAGQVETLAEQRNVAQQLNEDLRKATTPDLITSEGEKQMFKLLNNSSAKVKRSGRIMNNETARVVSNQIIKDLKEAGANGLFTLVHLRDENRALKSLAMDQSQTILELEKGMASQAEAFMDGSQRITINPRPARDNPFDGKFDKVIMDPQHVEHLKAIINGEPVDVVPDPKNGRIDELQERIEKLETHNDNLKAKVRRVVEESSNLEEALIKVARGH